MEARIKKLVDLYFENIPYSDETSNAHERIVDAMVAEYNAICMDKSPDEAFEQLVKNYGSLCDMAALAGYSAQQCSDWTADGTQTLQQAKKEFKKQRHRTYLLALFGAIAVIELFWLVYYFVYDPIWSLFVIALIGAISGATAFVLRRFIREEKNLTARSNKQ